MSIRLFIGTLLLIGMLTPTPVLAVGGDFQLIDHEGRPFKLNQLQGKIVLLFFGYTSCPDICPTELANFVSILHSLGNDADKVRGLFITVDPQRDTIQVLKQYLAFFNRNIIGLTGSQNAIDQVAKQYHARYQHNKSTKNNYTVDHTSNLYLIDTTGQVQAIIPYGLPIQHTLKMVKNLLEKPKK